VESVVLEKHADFLRDFRGDTIHPSTLEVMHELGILDAFLQRPHSETRHLNAHIGDARLTIADFSHLPTRCKFLAFMPQWDFLNFFAEQAKRYPAFKLRMQAEVTELIHDGERIAGCGRTPRRVSRRLAPISPSGRMGAIRRFAKKPASRSSTSVRRWMSCGCACLAGPAIRGKASAASRPAGSWR
jgi:2-polyprenyl-6-methoxyphenol hydroxylase-like FAD-dependent oxidoreductase